MITSIGVKRGDHVRQDLCDAVSAGRQTDEDRADHLLTRGPELLGYPDVKRNATLEAQHGQNRKVGQRGRLLVECARFGEARIWSAAWSSRNARQNSVPPDSLVLPEAELRAGTQRSG